MTGLERLLQQLSANQQPTFRPTAIEGLLKPQQAEMKPYSPETFTGLLNDQPSVMRQAGLIGGSFAPGAGFSDFAGTYPSARGGTEPSAAQNLQQGNYLTSALQTLGAFGDAATATGAALGPLGLAAGMGVGSIAKAPRAAQKGVEGLIDTVKPKLDELGFFSQVEKSVMDIPQQKGTGQQFLAQIQKTPGVKPEEIQYTGLDTFLANKPTVTKGEIQDHLDTNKVQVQEVTLGSPQALEARDSEIAQRYGYQADFDDGQMSFYDTNLDDYVEFRDLPAAMRTELSNPQTEFGGATKFHLGAMRNIQTEIPGGTNYREVLLTLPDENVSRIQKKQEINEQVIALNEQYGNRGGIPPEIREQITRLENEFYNLADSAPNSTFRSSHFDQPNILAHMRINDRTLDGKPTMFVEEIQSDWHQAGRKQGYQGQNEFAQLEKQLNDLQAQKRSLQANPEANQDIFGNLEAALAGQDTQISPKTSAYFEKITDLETKMADISEKMQGMAIGVPDAPFKTSWDELSLKRAIKMASDDGYEQIAFTTGKTQADRYNLSKKADAVGYFDNKRLVIYGEDGRAILTKEVPPDEIAQYTGKDVAKRLLSQDGIFDRMVKGVDFEVGGEGMKGFYDKMVPKKLEKIGKKYGAKPTKSTMQTPDGEVEVWKFDIPKEMRETVKEQGQPLFQIGAGAGLGGLLATEEEQY